MKGKIDVAGLRQVEVELQPLASVINIGLHAIVDGWGFLILLMEFDGDGAAWTCSTGDVALLPQLARDQARRLRAVTDPVIELIDTPENPDALSFRQVEQLSTFLRADAELIRHLLPPGWGFALLLFSKASYGRAWTSSAEREDMPEMLEEFALVREEGRDYLPGVAGRVD